MENLFSIKKNIIFLYLFFSIINLSLNIIIENVILSELETLYSKQYTIEGDFCLDYSLQFNINNLANINDIDSTVLKNSYIHISTISENNKAQILFTSQNECPTITDAEKYSYKYSQKSNFFMNYPDFDEFYITIKCFSYPCEFTLYSKVEKDYANLNIYETDSYSYFVTKEEKINTMAFKIPSTLNFTYSKNESHLLTIGVSNPSDVDYTQLYLVKNNKKTALSKVSSYKTPSIDKIFSFVEEDYIKEISENTFYVLEIESIEYQSVTISIKASMYDKNSGKLYSEILPNSVSKYSYLTSSFGEECFKVDENYLNDNVKEGDFLYASVEYFTNPIVTYLKYNENDEIPKETMDLSQRTINLILEKKSNKYPSICFNNEKKDTSFKLEVSHISKTNENIDIYNPLSSGFFYTKTLSKNNLALYTHNSDIHYIDKITFYLKVIKGNPNIYIAPCETYPNCFTTVSELENNNKIIKPEKSENIYSYTINNGHQKDLSPYGPTQNLLYVFCPEDTSDQYCQYEVMIYSNFDEIVILPNDRFYSNLLVDENDLFKIHIPKGNGDINKIMVMINITEESVVETDEEDMKNIAVNVDNIGNIKFCEFIPLNNKENEYDILFNIKAKKDFYYYIEYKFVGDENNFNIYNLEFEKIKEIDVINSFPIKIISDLPFTKENNKYNFKDLLFNCNFQSLNLEEIDIINTFEEMEINVTIINENELNDIIITNIDEKYFKSPLKKKFDKSTKSIILNINTDFLNKNKNDEKLILYMSISSVKNYIKKNINLSCKLFLFYKNNIDFIIPSNNYINDNLIVNNKYNYNLYHLKLETEEKIKYIVEFSANYELNNKELYISFLDYNNINNFKPENYLTNSTNINFINSGKKLGSIHQIEFTLKDTSLKDIILCVATNLKGVSHGISSINYIFKYNTYSINEYSNIITFGFNETILNYTKTTIKYSNIFAKTNDNKEVNIYGEISLRKILNNNKLNNEKLDTIAILESKYDLIEEGKESKKNKEVTINDLIIDFKKEYYSIFINSRNYNQKFVFNTIHEENSKNQNQKNEKKNNVLSVVLICSAVFIVLVIITTLIMNYKNKGKNLKKNVMQTSFGETGILDELNDVKKKEIN